MRSLLFFLLLTNFLVAAELRLEVSDVPDTGIVMTQIDLVPIANYLEIDAQTISGFGAACDGWAILTQFVGDSNRGTLILRLSDELVKKSRSQPLDVDLTLLFGQKLQPHATMLDLSIETPVYRITQNLASQGGLPSRIEFLKTGRVLDSHRWMDRLYKDGKSYDPTSDKLELFPGPICSIVRNTITFRNEQSELRPQAVYTWYYFADVPGLIYVTAHFTQPEPTVWNEKHFLELHVADGSFGQWSDLKQSDKRTEFTGTKISSTCPEGAAIFDGVNRIAFRSGPVVVYDGLNDFGPYMLASGQGTWSGWGTTDAFLAAWISVCGGEDDAMIPPPDRSRSRLSIPELDGSAKTWLDVAKNALFYAGILTTRAELDAFTLSEERFVAIRSERLGMLLERVEKQDGTDGNNQGIRLVALVDIPSLTLLTPPEAQSLFNVKARDLETKETKTLTADKGWRAVKVVCKPEFDVTNIDSQTGFNVEVEFSGPLEFPDRHVQLNLNLDAGGLVDEDIVENAIVRSHRLRPSIEMYMSAEISGVTLESVTLSQLKLAAFGSKMKGFYPQASGIVVSDPQKKVLNWQGRYPSGWCSMPWFAVWDQAKRTGLYVGTNSDATNNMRFQSDPNSQTVSVFMEFPAENIGKENSSLFLNKVILKSFHGDWYDAAQIHRGNVSHPHVKGRRTPQWMKDLCVWAIGGDVPEKMPEVMRKFRDALGMPVGLHWYNWHEIPFDNDYPHYFPVKPGFGEAVAEIQKDGDMFVMPYINGRLWDTRDKGMEDFEFTSVALPGATKKEDGTPYTESYGSKEADGSDVVLGVMCPASEVWKNKVKENILRLVRPLEEGGYGVKSVYVDQVAAAQPELCFDPTHGHPLGGGNWWVETYRDMFNEIRAEIPKDAMLTTECNADPFIDMFDGYLSWHYQYDGQVPAFSAIYGGRDIIQFGRHFGGGPDSVVACRMKLAESFVYGEQLGWINPHIVNEPEKIEYLKKVVTLRYKFRDLFYEGCMGRPPQAIGPMPRITADWNFMGPTITTTDVIHAGLWYNTDKLNKRALLLFANCSPEEVRCDWAIDLSECDLGTFKVTRHDAGGTETPLEKLPQTLAFKPLEVFVLEIK